MRALSLLLFVLGLAAAPPLQAAALEPMATGVAPVLRLQDLDGGAHDLADYRGKVVLVNFWATWCEPCREEMPALEGLEKRFAGQPFAVLTVNVGEPASRVRKFLSQFAFNLPVLLDPGRRVTKAWQVRLMPSSYLIGPDGTVRYAAVGAIDWSAPRAAERIRRLLPQS